MLSLDLADAGVFNLGNSEVVGSYPLLWGNVIKHLFFAMMTSQSKLDHLSFEDFPAK